MNQTVIIPAYKADWCLQECIDSISKQENKPDEVLIGVDACKKTLRKAKSIAGIHKKMHGRTKTKLNISVFWFPDNSGPYRVKNTLATLCNADIIHFFDADDLMHTNHCKDMAGILDAGKFAVADALIERKDKRSKEHWERAHGVISMYRNTFIMFGGFEPWRCAADTEAHHRWIANGLAQVRPDKPTMTVRKHENGLTMAQETGYSSPLRQEYRAEITKRIKEPIRLGHIAIGSCVCVTDSADMWAVPGIDTPKDIIKQKFDKLPAHRRITAPITLDSGETVEYVVHGGK